MINGIPADEWCSFDSKPPPKDGTQILYYSGLALWTVFPQDRQDLLERTHPVLYLDGPLKDFTIRTAKDLIDFEATLPLDPRFCSEEEICYKYQIDTVVIPNILCYFLGRKLCCYGMYKVGTNGSKFTKEELSCIIYSKKHPPFFEKVDNLCKLC
jgi:hypothetical protein